MKTRALKILATMNLLALLLFVGAVPSIIAGDATPYATQLWEANCASCHGADGKGQTLMGQRLGAKDFTDPNVQASFTDDDATKAIKYGVTNAEGTLVMKAFTSLSDADIQDLVMYVRAFVLPFTYITNGTAITITGYTALGGDVTIPSTINGYPVTTIGTNAFSGSILTSVTIPDSVTSIGGYAFSDCYYLTEAFFLGNAPNANGGPGSADASVFTNETGTVYYVPGTTGWSTYFGGWPTAQWYQPQPQIFGSGYGLGVGSQGFQFTISWATNATVVVEASTNLQDWIPISTNTLVNGTSTFLDSAWTNHSQRFYRVRPQ